MAVTSATFSGYSTDDLLQLLLQNLTSVKNASGYSTDQLLQYLLAALESGAAGGTAFNVSSYTTWVQSLPLNPPAGGGWWNNGGSPTLS